MRTRIIPAAVLAAAALLASAGAASASAATSPHVTVQATTIVTDRPDGGNGSPDPYWADDDILRSMTITQTGGTAGNWTFTAHLGDMGNFTTIKGKQAPNQGAPYTGQVIKSKATGIMMGSADFTFTASKLPGSGFNAGVPSFESDHGNVPADDTSTWYEMAFPAGTVFSGAGIGHWSWTYTLFAPRGTQQWTDGWNNGYGNTARDGQIAG